MFLSSYSGIRVLITGDTGFKGAWLASWLCRLGAQVYGLALPPADESALFTRARLQGKITHLDGDICDLTTIEKTLAEVQPRIIFHLAAQALVRESYQTPVATMMTNVIGTAHLCDALRRYGAPCALVVVTSDKCYENHEWVYGYRENDSMGGSDPYSASKGAAELVTASWRSSFFPPKMFSAHGKAVATVRAGNVIGPGDWAKDRIVPDAIAALLTQKAVPVRNPDAVRPWQHVLEPLSGYLWLGVQLMGDRAADFSEAWNFGPLPANVNTVKHLVEALIKSWGTGSWQMIGEPNPPPEAHLLRLVIDKAVARLLWSPVWSFNETISHTVEGYRLIRGQWNDPETIQGVIENQIASYEGAAKSMGVTWAVQ
jgi:CDP-glucose 4,6-dehydratase